MNVLCDVWQSFLLYLSSYLLLAGISHRWRCLPEYSCCQGSPTENIFQIHDSAKYYPDWKIQFRDCISVNYKGASEQGCSFSSTGSSKYIWLLVPTDLEKSKEQGQNSEKIRAFQLFFMIRLPNKMRRTICKDISVKEEYEMVSKKWESTDTWEKCDEGFKWLTLIVLEKSHIQYLENLYETKHSIRILNHYKIYLNTTYIWRYSYTKETLKSPTWDIYFFSLYYQVHMFFINR